MFGRPKSPHFKLGGQQCLGHSWNAITVRHGGTLLAFRFREFLSSAFANPFWPSLLRCDSQSAIIPLYLLFFANELVLSHAIRKKLNIRLDLTHSVEIQGLLGTVFPRFSSSCSDANKIRQICRDAISARMCKAIRLQSPWIFHSKLDLILLPAISMPLIGIITLARGENKSKIVGKYYRANILGCGPDLKEPFPTPWIPFALENTYLTPFCCHRPLTPIKSIFLTSTGRS